MKEILLIARKEFTASFRDRRFWLLEGLLVLLLGLALATGSRHYRLQQEERERASQEKREQWLGQGEKHPHIAAHFGTFAFKPKSLLSAFDPGLDTYAGTTVYLEAHRQHDLVFKPAQHFSSAIRFGEISGALVLQVLLPLLIVFLGFASVSAERESGTLRLLLSQGLSRQKLLWGKMVGLTAIIGVMVLPVALLAVGLAVASSGGGTLAQPGWRTGILIGAYFLYLALFGAITVLVSALSRSSRTSLLLLLTFWVFTCILLPKATANFADGRYPLPSSFAFRTAVEEGVLHGIDGHNPRDQRSEEYTKSLLVKYQVDSVSQLPVNHEGLLMHAGEKYTSQVYDRHFSELQRQQLRQNQVSAYASLLNPFLAIRNLSMGLAGTDYHTHVDFQRTAELYRRQFVQAMNEDMAFNSRMGEFNTYKANRRLWEQTEDLRYTPVPIMTVLRQYWLELMALASWALLLLFLTWFLASKIRYL